MKEERFPHTRKPLRGWRLWVVEGGRSFGATEESAATGLQRAKWRDSCTEARRRAALTSPRGLSAPLSLSAGAGGGWELRLGLRSDPRERTGVGGEIGRASCRERVSSPV